MDQKRGRKSKTAIFEYNEEPKIENSKIEDNAPKKRGRPKTKNLDGSTQPKGNGKRGRKPKERVYEFVESTTNPFQADPKNDESDSESENETLILKIPIDNENDIYSIPEDDNGPEPFEGIKPRFSTYDKKTLSEIKERIESLPSKLKDIEKEREKEAQKYLKHLSSKDIKTTFQVQELIKDNDEENSEYKKEKKENIHENTQNKDTLFKKRSIPIDNYLSQSQVIVNYVSEYTLMPEFLTSQKNGKLPTRTNIHCWWDTYQFNHQPVGYPIKHTISNQHEIVLVGTHTKINSQPIKVTNHHEYPNDRFYVSGCFCSYNCMLAYVKSRHINCDQLLKYMFKVIHGNKLHIKPAPPFQALERFGGPLSITKFRESFDVIDYTLLEIPIISVPPNLEEKESINNNKFIDNNNNNNNNNKSIDNNNTIQNNTSQINGDLRLRRSKPLKGSKGTLENFMNIKLNLNI